MTSFKINFKKFKNTQKKAFTLPEVIVSFSVLIMVITSAAGILASVIRSNGDNVNSLVAYGLAQEGIEAMRFVRDSNFALGLDFDGVTKSLTSAPFGAKLYDTGLAGEVKIFKLVMTKDVQPSCAKDILFQCLPLQLVEISGDLESLQSSEEGRVFQLKDEQGGLQYLQLAGAGDLEPSMFKRLIRVENLGEGKLRVSVWVSWNGISSNQPRQIVLTTELTDWRA